MLRVLAVDLGATSVRVAEIDLDATPPTVEVLHRYHHAPVEHGDGTLRWAWDRLLVEVDRGLDRGLARGPVASIGVDTWGVDYGLLDASGRLVAPPVSYRDRRTAGWRAVAERLGPDRLYQRTGIQLMAINTVFQLAAHEAGELGRARTLLMLPELVVHHLTGAVTGERTSAGTTGLVDCRTGEWATDLVEAVGVDPGLLPPLRPATTAAGRWRGVPVHLVGGHDTASAVAAMAGVPRPGAAFLSSGTWFLVGAERPAPDTSPAARRANFSNEPGALGGVRFLRNVAGFWLLEQCRPAWGAPPVDELVRAAARLPAGGPVVDATDERFLAPADMEAEIRAAAGLPQDAGRDQVVRCVLDSVATAAGRVVGELGELIGRPVTELHVVGGGSRLAPMNELLAEATGVPVRAGSAEATALGNALVQGVALGRFADLDDARAAVDPGVTGGEPAAARRSPGSGAG